MDRPLLFIGALLLVTGCVRRADGPAKPAEPVPTVTVAQPTEETIADQLVLPGRSAAAATVDLRSRVGGHLLKIHYTEGSEVRAGQKLAEIDAGPFEAAVAQARANLEVARVRARVQEREVARSRELATRGTITPQALEQSVGARDETLATIRSLEAALAAARLDLGDTSLHAPISGRVGRNALTEGNLVVANVTSITTIVSLDPIHVYFEADEVTWLGHHARLEAPGRDRRRWPAFLSLEGLSGERAGYIDFTDSALDPDTGTWTLRATFPNRDRAVAPGLSVRVRVPLGDPEAVLVVPEEALETDQRGNFLKIVLPDGKVEDRVVVAGRAKEGQVVIQKGIGPEDRVIVRGGQRARAGARVDARPLERTTTPAPKAKAAR